jgi:hypothetical protein
MVRVTEVCMREEERLYDLLAGGNLEPVRKIVGMMGNPHDKLVFALNDALKAPISLREYIIIDKIGLKLVKRMALERGDLASERLIENCDILLGRFADDSKR